MTRPIRLLAALSLVLTPLLSCGSDDSGAPRVPFDIILVPNHPVVAQGRTLQLRATVVDIDGRAISGENVIFRSSDTDILTVDAQGLMTSVGAAPGSAIVTAEDDGLTQSIEVAVTQRAVSLTVTPNPLLLNRGATAVLSVAVKDFNGDPFPANGATFESSDQSLVSISPFGEVSAPGPLGDAVITVTFQELSTTVPVTVALIPTTILATPSSVVLAPHETQQLAVTVNDAVGNPIPHPGLTYTSTAPTKFSVSSEGLITSLGPSGSGTVRVKAGSLTASVGVLIGNGSLGRLIATTTIPGQGYGVAVAADGATYVGILNGTRVFRGTIASHHFPTGFQVGFEPLGIGVNPTGTVLYVALGGTQGVAQINTATNTALPRLVGPWPDAYSVATSSDGQKVFVGTDGWIYIYDAASQQLVDSVAGSTVIHLAVSKTGPLVYGSNNSNGTVTEYNYLTKQSRIFAVGGSPQAVGLSPSGNELYLADESGFLTVWDVTHNQRLQSVALGGGGFGLAVSKNRILVTIALGGQVKLFDRVSRVLIASINTGGVPRRAAYDGSGTAIVANEAGWVDFIK